ncbi:hypothetical protein [Campylobacter sp. CCS1377]|uniref:Uncharacterized protein n=1 Tax=Campylobacter sp. CCS1377 TaxID=3158229 RepID=A0AAU7E738_9BACT|nr:hypothetical protein [Campylobacter jejuni]
MQKLILLFSFLSFVHGIDLTSIIDSDFFQSSRHYRSSGDISKLDSLLGTITSFVVKSIFVIVVLILILSYF